MLCTTYATYCDITGDNIVTYVDAILMALWITIMLLGIRVTIGYVRRYLNG